jgi:hypothetical protein
MFISFFPQKRNAKEKTLGCALFYERWLGKFSAHRTGRCRTLRYCLCSSIGIDLALVFNEFLTWFCDYIAPFVLSDNDKATHYSSIIFIASLAAICPDINAGGTPGPGTVN